MTIHQIKITRPDEEEMAYFWKLFHAASRNETRWGGSTVEMIADELGYCPNLERKEKLFLLRAWQVLVDDKGGFGRFMSAFETYVLNMQDPEQDVVAWKPEIIRMSEDADLLPVLLEAYEEALLETRCPLPIGELLARLEGQTGEKWIADPHHNGMMQLSNELAELKRHHEELQAVVDQRNGECDRLINEQQNLVMLVKVLCRSLKKYNHGSDLVKRAMDYLTKGGFISATDLLRGGVLSAHDQTDTAPAQFEALAGNSPEMPEGSMMLSPEGAQLLAEIIGGHAAVVTFLTMGRPDLALEESSKWVEGIDQAAELFKAQEAKS